MYLRKNNYHKARLKGCRAHAATGWIHANPLPLTKFTNDQFKIASHIWLGIPLVNRQFDCKFCGTKMDIFGAHAATCKSGANIVKRRNSIRNYIYSQMKIANYTCMVEKKYLNGNGQKPADIYVESLVDCRPTAVDVSITSCVQKNIVQNVNDRIYQAADEMTRIKENKYKNFIEQADCEFIPFICETFKGIASKARDLIRKIAHDQKTRPKRSFSSIMARIQKYICVKIWKAVIEAVIERLFWVKDMVLDAG